MSLMFVLGGVLGAELLKRGVMLFFDQIGSHLSKPQTMAKTRTIRSLIKHSISAVVSISVLIMILAQWGVNITPLLTGAGILGLAISFGSQTLVKDIISGFFIIVENQYNVGDEVRIIDKYEGKVLAVTLRLTVLRDKEGNKIFIPNSQITTVVRKKST